MLSAKVFNRLHFLLASTLLLLLSCSGEGNSLLFSFATNTPSNLRVSADNLDITLSWDAVEEAESYSVYRYTNAGCAYLPDNYNQCDQAKRWSRISVTSIEDADLDNDTSYHYRVLAHGAESDSELSDEVSATIEPAVIPEPARNVVISLEPGVVYLQWTGDSNADYYVVYRVTDTQTDGCAIPESFTSCGESAEALQSSQLEASQTNWSNDSITDGGSYYYTVVSYSSYGSSNSESIFVTTIPDSPVISDASSSNAGLQLQWTESLGASYYELYRYSVPGCLDDSSIGTFANCNDALMQGDLTSAEYLDDISGVTTTNVYYRLRAGNSSGLSYLSEEYHYNLGLSPPDDFNVDTSGYIHNLYWSEVSRATGYSLYRYTDASCSSSPATCSDVVVSNLAADILSYADETAIPGVLYYYRLRARDNSGWSAYTDEVNTSTAPLPVSDLQASASDQQVSLSWDGDENAGDTVYTIYRSECAPELIDCDAMDAVGTVEVSASSFSDTGLDNAQKYYYLVNSSVEGWEVNSSIISATTDAKDITDLTASAADSNSVQLGWDSNANEDDANYSVYLYSCLPSSTDCGLNRTEALGTGHISTYYIDNLDTGSRYYFRVGVSANGVEHNTSTVDAYTKPLAPDSISYEAGVDEITIFWQSSNGDDTTYEVESYVCADGGCEWDTNIHIPSSDKNFTYENLTPGEAYSIRVRARSGAYEAVSAGEGEGGGEDIFTTPTAPTLELTAGHNSIILSWDASANGGNTTYTPVRYACGLEENCTGSLLDTMSGSGYLDYNDTNLVSGSLYSYLIRATNAHLSTESDALSETTAPFPPGDIDASGGDRAVTVSWEVQGSELPNYDLYQSLEDCSIDDLLDNDTSNCGIIELNGSIVPEGNADSIEATFTNLQPATKYYYNIRAYNPSNDLYSFSDSSEAAITDPVAPTNVEAQSQSSGITLSWSAGDNGAEATWRLYRYSCIDDDSSCTTPDPGYELDFDYNVTSFIDEAEDITPANEYYYVISAMANNNEVKADPVTALAAPTDLRDLAASSGVTVNSSEATDAETAGLYVELSWSSNGNALDTNYTVYRKDCAIDGACEEIYQFDSYTGVEDYEITFKYDDKDDIGNSAPDLKPATLYTYIVNMSVGGSESNEDTVEGNSSVEVITRPVAVTELSVSNISDEEVTLDWNGSANGEKVSYKVYSYSCTMAAAADSGTVGEDCADLKDYDETKYTTYSVHSLHPGSYHSLLVHSLVDEASTISTSLNNVITKPVAASDIVATVSASDSDDTMLSTTWASTNGSATTYNRYLYECSTDSNCYVKSISSEIEYAVNDAGLYNWNDSYSEYNLSRVYEVVIAAETASGEVNATAVRFAPLPKAADGLSAEAINANTIELSWSNTGAHTSHKAYVFATECDIETLAADISDSGYNPCNIVYAKDTNNSSNNFANPISYKIEFDNLTPGTLYYFAVKTINDSGETWAENDELNATTHPSVVTALNANASTDTINISWDSSDNGAETSYKVYIYELGCTDDCHHLAYSSPIDVGKNTSYVATGLRSGSDYNVTIASVADGFEVNASSLNIVTVPVVPDSIIATLNPGSPTDSIDLNWSASSIDNGAATSYRLLRFACSGSNCSHNDANLSIDTDSFDNNYTDVNLASGSGFQYMLQAYASDYEANSSFTSTVYTNSSPVEEVSVSDIAADGFKVVFTMPQVNGDDTSYGVYLGECSGASESYCNNYEFNELDQDQAEFEFEELQSAQYYGVFVAALIDGYEANSTTEVIATLPVAVTNLESSVVDQNISLTYSSVNGSAAGYIAYLYEYTSSEDKSVVKQIDDISTSHTIDQLNAGTKYDIVVAVSSDNFLTNEINSSSVSSTTYPLVVSALAAVAGDQSISLSWTNGPGVNNLNGAATTHTVYRYECDPSSGGCIFPASTAADSATSHESTGLDHGEGYYYIIGAQAEGVEVSSNAITASTLPTALSDLATIGLADSLGVEISYSSANGSSSTYTAYRYDCGDNAEECNTDGDPNEIIVLNASGGTDANSALQAASYYRYFIGVSSGRQEINATAESDALTKPEAPGLDVNNISSSDSAISISSYEEPTGVINSHYLVLSENDCTDLEIEAGDTSVCGDIATSNTKEFTGLSANTEYFLRILVANATGTAFSSTVSVTTLPEIPDVEIFGIDLGLQVVFNSTNSVDTNYTFLLSDSNSSCPDNAEDGGDCNFDHNISNVIPGIDFKITDDNISADEDYFARGTVYFGAIQATNSAGSSYTQVVSAITVPAPPDEINATGGTKQISFSWSESKGASSYHLRVYSKSEANGCDISYMKIDQDGELNDQDVVRNCGETHAENVSESPYEATISDLGKGLSYFYRLGSSSDDISVNWSEEYSMDTLPDPPYSLSAKGTTSNTVTLSWSLITGQIVTQEDIYAYTTEGCATDVLLSLSEDLNGSEGNISNTACGDFFYIPDKKSGYTVTELTASSNYYFRVAVVNAAGSSLSNELAYTTSASSATQSLAVKLNEPLQSEQWYLTNTGQQAHAGYSGIANVDINHSGALELGFTGSNIRVNVIDTGMEMQHPDLLANIVADGSYDYVDDDNDPSNYATTSGDHGTSVAGLIAADDNGAGITGVAPDALLQAFNYLRSSQTTSDYLLAHGGDTKLDDTAIFNKSLGVRANDDYRIDSTRLEALSCFTSGGATDHGSPESCSEALRSGLGAIYVKAAGNDFADANDELCLSFGLSCRDANMDAEHTYPYQVVVGALNASGVKSSYSNAGSALWLTAPAGEYGWDYDFIESELNKYGYTLSYDASNPTWYPAMLTTDQVGCERGNTTYRYDFGISGVPPIGVTQFHEDDTLNPDCDYSSTFNGTSAATPVVSGVIALMLEANANLSWRDVKHILAASSDVIDPSIAEVSIPVLLCSTDCSDGQYTASDSLEFVARDSWQTNAAGYDFHNWYGFGAANAGAAVAMAQAYASQLGQWQKLSVSQSFNQDIPDATGSALQVSINQPDDITVEAVQLDLQIDHSYLGNLSVVLVSPSGTRSVLLTPFGLYDDDVDFDANLLSNAFYGEAAAGDWQLQIYDLMQADTGSLVSATLNVYGH